MFCSVQSEESPRATSTCPNDLGHLFSSALLGYGFFLLNSSCPVSVQPRTGKGTGYYEPALTAHFLCVRPLRPLTCDSTQVPCERRQPAASALRQPGPRTSMRDAKRRASGGQLLRMRIRSYLETQSSRLQSNTLKVPAFHCQQSLKFIPSAPVLPVG